MINNNWCTSRNIVPPTQSYTPSLELMTIKYHPCYLPCEFTLIIFSANYIPPQGDTVTALSELHEALTNYQADHWDAALIVARDFNWADLRTIKATLPDLQDIYTARCRLRAKRITGDPSHPSNGLFSMLRVTSC